MSEIYHDLHSRVPKFAERLGIAVELLAAAEDAITPHTANKAWLALTDIWSASGYLMSTPKFTTKPFRVAEFYWDANPHFLTVAVSPVSTWITYRNDDASVCVSGSHITGEPLLPSIVDKLSLFVHPSQE